jgi:DNA repair exonuclease SbcCD ATPase subunit
VRLSSIDLSGFGCLSGFRADLGPGLNLFFGDNEAGKSTLQQAICAMLYGFHDGERATAAENARHKRFRPWSNGVYRGVLTYSLEDGRGYEVRRDFSTSDVITQVIDAAMGQDVSSQFGRGRHGHVPFARTQLGMSRSVFESCAFISQGEIFELSKNAPTEIGDAIAALADSARRDVSAAKAIEKLEAATRRIGRDSARTAELPVARDNLRRKREELAAADAARAGVAGKARRLDELQATSRNMAAEVLRLELACHQADAARLRDELQKLDEVESLLARAAARRDELRRYATVPTTMRDEIQSLWGQLQGVNEALRRLDIQRKEPLSQVTDELRLEYETLRLSVGALGDEQLAALKAIAYRRADTGTTGHHGSWAAAGRLLRAIGRAIASALRRLFRRPAHRATPGEEPSSVQPACPPRREPAEVYSGIQPEEAVALLERHRRYLTLQPLIERANTLGAQAEAEAASAAALETQLRSLLRTAGIEAGALEAGVAAFAEACDRRQAHEKAAAAAEQAEARRSAILAGRTREEMTSTVAEHEASCRRLANPRAGAPPAAPARGNPARALQAARERLHQVQLEAESLEAEVRVALERFRPRAEIEEELAHWEKEVARLEKARSALVMAKDAIGEAMTAVYRDFAPAVNAFLSEGIEAATDGRYTRAHVDPATLRISLLVPETGQLMTDPPVSHGTRTLLYVLMRIGLAQHMSAIGEAVPLVLDDPFVDVDARRLRRMLEFLLRLSERMQVLLFTKDGEILSWFEDNAADGPHKAHIMSGALSATLL